jgi:hypothetical protein
MRLYEFTDPRSYSLPTDHAAANIKQVERAWRNYGVDADAPMLCRIIDELEDKTSELIDTSVLCTS